MAAGHYVSETRPASQLERNLPGVDRVQQRSPAHSREEGDSLPEGGSAHAMRPFPYWLRLLEEATSFAVGLWPLALICFTGLSVGLRPPLPSLRQRLFRRAWASTALFGIGLAML